MHGFLGSYLHQIDEKGRLNLPAAFRREAAPETPFVLIQAHADALTLYPSEAWSGVEARLRELLRLQPEARPFVLRVVAHATEVVPDRQGRILIPQRLQHAAGLAGATLVVGVLDRIELWHPDRFEAVTSARPSDSDRFAHQIFG
jgi:MraZ protein